jgi:hypothetical protein
MSQGDYEHPAQCLYVLTDDNQPAIDDVRASSSYLSCLYDIARAQGKLQDPKGKTPAAAEERAITLSILACGPLLGADALPVTH